MAYSSYEYGRHVPGVETPPLHKTQPSIPRQRQREDAQQRGCDDRINVSSPERIASVAGGLALAAWGFRHCNVFGSLLAVAGASVIHRGVTGHCPMYGAIGIDTEHGSYTPTRLSNVMARDVTHVHTATIRRPIDDVYDFWRHLDNFPRIMPHLRTVAETSSDRSHWSATGPGDREIEWDAEIVEDREGETIAWRTLPGSTAPHEGRVDFKPAPGDRGTIVRLWYRFKAPMGRTGERLTRTMFTSPRNEAEATLRRAKQVLEAGEIATARMTPERATPDEAVRTRYGPDVASGVPTSRTTPAAATPPATTTPGHEPRRTYARPDYVGEASEESFPASDAPGWGPQRG